MGLELNRILNRKTRVNICQVRTREKRWYCQPERELRGCLSCLRGDQTSQLKMEDDQSISMSICHSHREEGAHCLLYCSERNSLFGVEIDTTTQTEKWEEKVERIKKALHLASVQRKKYRSVWQWTGKATWVWSWNFFKRKVLILSGIHVPSKRKELLRESSRSNSMNTSRKKL